VVHTATGFNQQLAFQLRAFTHTSTSACSVAQQGNVFSGKSPPNARRINYSTKCGCESLTLRAVANQVGQVGSFFKQEPRVHADAVSAHSGPGLWIFTADGGWQFQ
jgi:hypothetical protein